MVVLFHPGKILPSGYAYYRHDKITLGGGLMPAFHNSLTSCQLNTMSNLEIVSVAVAVNSSVLICVVCLPPTSYFTYYSEVFQYLEFISSNFHVVIVGDFNRPEIS